MPDRAVALNFHCFKIRVCMDGGGFSPTASDGGMWVFLPLPDAELQKMQHCQPPGTLMPICLKPQKAQGLDQEARQEDRKGQPPPEETTCGKVVNYGAEAWGKDKMRGVKMRVRQCFTHTRLLSSRRSHTPKTFLPQTAQGSSENMPGICTLANSELLS